MRNNNNKSRSKGEQPHKKATKIETPKPMLLATQMPIEQLPWGLTFSNKIPYLCYICWVSEKEKVFGIAPFCRLSMKSSAKCQENVIKICNAIHIASFPSFSLFHLFFSFSLSLSGNIEEAIKMSLNCKKFCLDFHYFIAYFFSVLAVSRSPHLLCVSRGTVGKTTSAVFSKNSSKTRFLNLLFRILFN